MAVKALACELPATRGVPLARWHCADQARAAVAQGIVASIHGSTIWRWLSADAIQPWRHRSWIFPRDPDFAAKAGRVLDLYACGHNHRPLGPDDYVISADEKASIQARDRRHHSTPPGPRQPLRVEHEYHRRGALAYLAAWDVHQAKVFGRCEAIYFSVVQRKVLTPNDFTDLAQVRARLLDFQDYDAQIATPFEWQFTRADLHRLLARSDEAALPHAA